MDWKGTLASVAGVLVLILQVINVLLSNDIDSSIGRKAVLMEEKAAQLQSLVNAKNEVQQERLNSIKEKLDEAEKALRAIPATPAPAKTP